MPSYITPSGIPCSQSDAMSAGYLKPGYKQIAGDGERIGFNLAFMDSKPVNTSDYLNVLTPQGSVVSIRNYARDNRINPTGEFIPVADTAPVQTQTPKTDPATARALAVRDLAKISRVS